MALEALAPGQPGGGTGEPGGGLGVEADEGDHLHEVAHGQRRGKPRRSRGGHDVAGAGDVVAESFPRVLPEKDAAGVLHLAQPGIGVFDREAEVLGGVEVGEAHRHFQAFNDDDAAIFQRFFGHLPAGEFRQLGPDFALDRVGEGLAQGDEPGLGQAIVLGLRQKVGGDEGGVGRLVGDDQRFRGAGQAFNPHVAEDFFLGQGDEQVPRADDLFHPGHPRGPVGQGCDGLGAAHGKKPVGAGDPGRGQDGGVRVGRGGNDDLLHPGHAGGDDGHQDRGKKRGTPARDVHPHPLQGTDELAR